MMDQGSVRNLEQIQEHDEPSRTPKAVTFALVMLGGACVVFASIALGGRSSAPVVTPADPLGDLVAQRRAGASGAPVVKATDLSAKDVTFPGMLSDDTTPTTALAAVRPGSAQAEPAGGGAGITGFAPSTKGEGEAPTLPPPASDRLSVVPIPAQNVLEATPVITRPRDALTKAATDSGQINTAAAAQAPAGHDGGYQLQVSSFRSQDEANQFADQLRARGHKSYVLEAHVNGRGTWYRVRVGPFATQHAAASYRAGFESKEHVVPFIVPPPGKEGEVASPHGASAQQRKPVE